MTENEQRRKNILAEIAGERKRQIDKGFNEAHDDAQFSAYGVQSIVETIQGYVGWARVQFNMGSPDKARRRLINVAALAVSAVESLDRLFFPTEQADKKNFLGWETKECVGNYTLYVRHTKTWGDDEPKSFTVYSNSSRPNVTMIIKTQRNEIRLWFSNLETAIEIAEKIVEDGPEIEWKTPAQDNE